MIQYLNNAANEISYVNKDGVTITRNPFDAEFVLISQRLSLQHSNAAENQQRRKNYETAVQNAQASIDAGRPPLALPPVPDCIVTPEDYSVDVTTGPWEPALLTVKAASGVPVPMVDLGPDSAGRHESTMGHIANIVTAIGPSLPSLLELLRSLLALHTATKTPANGD